MCIICNSKDLDAADKFLAHFDLARTNMKKAEHALLAVVYSMSESPERENYKKLHKLLVKARKNYNRLEQIRESKGTHETKRI